jgi:hypothetical protein
MCETWFYITEIWLFVECQMFCWVFFRALGKEVLLSSAKQKILGKIKYFLAECQK